MKVALATQDSVEVAMMTQVEEQDLLGSFTKAKTKGKQKKKH